MRILHCIGFYDERYLYREQYYTQILAENGENEVFMLSSTSGQPHSPDKSAFAEGETKHGNVTLIRKKPYFQYKDMILFHFKKEIDRIQPDLVHVYEFRQWITYRVARYCVERSIPVVYEHEQRSEGISTLGIMRSRLTVNRWLRELLPFLSALRSATPGAAEYVQRCALKGKAHVALCTLGFKKEAFHIDHQARQELRRKFKVMDNEILLGTTGKFDSSKHIDLIIEAYKNTSNSNLRLVLIGKANPAYEAFLQSAIQNTNKPIIYINELQNQVNLNKSLNMLDYSIWTAPTISYFEAMGTGLKIIIPRGSGTSHLNSKLIQFYGNERSIDEHNKIKERGQVLAEICNIFDNLKPYERNCNQDANKFEIASIVRELHEQYRKVLQS